MYSSYPLEPVYPVLEIMTFEFLKLNDKKLNFLIDVKSFSKTSFIKSSDFGP